MHAHKYNEDDQILHFDDLIQQSVQAALAPQNFFHSDSLSLLPGMIAFLPPNLYHLLHLFPAKMTRRHISRSFTVLFRPSVQPMSRVTASVQFSRCSFVGNHGKIALYGTPADAGHHFSAYLGHKS
jgi:hypothetical protein